MDENKVILRLGRKKCFWLCDFYGDMTFTAVGGDFRRDEDRGGMVFVLSHDAIKLQPYSLRCFMWFTLGLRPIPFTTCTSELKIAPPPWVRYEHVGPCFGHVPFIAWHTPSLLGTPPALFYFLSIFIFIVFS